MSGIDLGSQFNFTTTLALDARQVAADITARDALAAGVRYRGLTVFVISTAKFYSLVGGITNSDWVDMSGANASASNALTAFAGGGQASALALTAHINRITTVATAGDSVKLPAATAGTEVIVINDGANSMDIFPATGESINSLAVNIAYALSTSDKNVMFICPVAGLWKTAAGGGSSASGGGVNWITNGAAESNTTGWSVYGIIELPTFTDAGDLVTLSAHGLSTGQTVSFPSITSTTGISTGTTYYVIYASSSTFQLASTLALAQAGTALALTTNGSGSMLRGTPYYGGTGASAGVTISTTASSPLSGSNSFTFVKPGSNCMGSGWVYAFSIDIASKARVQSIKFDYQLLSGTFTAGSSTADSDVTVWVYDVTNSILIQPSSYKLLSSSTAIPDSFQAEFQTSSNSTSYRLIFHCASSNANAYTLLVDSVQVSPSQYVFGSPISDIIDAGTITIKAVTTDPTKGTTTSDKVTYVREGKYAVITYSYRQTAVGSAGSGEYLVSLPSGLSADTSLISVYTTAGPLANVPAAVPSSLDINTGVWNDGGAGAYDIHAHLYSATQFRLNVTWASTNAVFGSGSWALSSATLGIKFTIRVPIQGWASSVQMADQTSTRVIGMSAYSAATIAQHTTAMVFPTVSFDTHNTYNATTGIYTVPAPGLFQMELTSVNSATANCYYNTYKNGVFYSTLAFSNSFVGSGSLIIQCNAGDTLSVGANGNMNNAGSVASTLQPRLSIHRISGPSQIASSETVAASYWLSANFASSTTIPVNFDSKEFDTHGCVTTSATAFKFTAPISGLYSIQGQTFTTSGAGALLYKNGTAYKGIGSIAPSASNTGTLSGAIMLNAGDYIDVRPNAAVTITGGSLSGVTTGNISITRIGNRG